MLHIMFLLVTASAGTVSFSASDGQALKGELQGKGAQGVLLVHDADRSRTDWSSFEQRLAGQGFQVLAIDLRGHGASTATLDPADYPKMTQDLAAGVGYLKRHGAIKISIVGAGLGANLGLNAAAADPIVTNLVMLSPGLNIKGVKVAAAMAAYGERPMMLVAGSDDALSAKAASLLAREAKGDSELLVIPDAGSGTKMLNRAPDLESTLVSWLKGTYRLAHGEGNGVERELESSKVDDINTTGTKLEDRYK